jgi:CheY-like chemotaxis protein
LKPLAVRAQQKGLQLRFCTTHDGPTTIIADQHRLRQVLMNLVGNAIKFTEHGTINVDVACIRQPATNKAVLRLSVQDSGCGIAAERLPHIFKPFVQEDGLIAERYGGTGLGLTISQQLIGLMGGQIEVESIPGQGSRFWFAVPVEVSSAAALQPLANTALPERDQAPMRVLLVEDNMVNQRLALRLLEKRGHRVTVADDGRKAVALAADEDFDIALMDVQMPELDGLEATQLIRADEQARCRRRLPIVALTAHAMKRDEERCRAAGMDGYLTKPVDVGSLFAVMRQLAQRP